MQAMINIPNTKKNVKEFLKHMERRGYTVKNQNGHYSFYKDGNVDINYSAFIAAPGFDGAFIGVRPGV